MTMRPLQPSTSAPPRPARLRTASRLGLAGLLGLAAAVIVACGSTGKGLIPTGASGPLQSDFESVAQAAQSGEGNCTKTEAALAKTNQDFAALPASVDAGLRNTLRQGIDNLRSRALALCAQPLTQGTVTNTTPKTTSTSTTTPTTTETTPTTTTPTTPTNTTPTEPGPGGGTQAPGSEAENGQGSGGGTGAGSSGGVGAGGAGAGENGK